MQPWCDASCLQTHLFQTFEQADKNTQAQAKHKRKRRTQPHAHTRAQQSRSKQRPRHGKSKNTPNTTPRKGGRGDEEGGIKDARENRATEKREEEHKNIALRNKTISRSGLI